VKREPPMAAVVAIVGDQVGDLTVHCRELGYRAIPSGGDGH
jgi:hypothetical protein